jgi:hypothetical protein
LLAGGIVRWGKTSNWPGTSVYMYMYRVFEGGQRGTMGSGARLRLDRPLRHHAV